MRGLRMTALVVTVVAVLAVAGGYIWNYSEPTLGANIGAGLIIVGGFGLLILAAILWVCVVVMALAQRRDQERDRSIPHA